MSSPLQLQSLWNVQQKELNTDIKNFIRDWNKNHKCVCCKNWRNGDNLIECEHMQKEKIKKFKKRNFNQFRRIFLLRSFSLKRLIQN